MKIAHLMKGATILSVKEYVHYPELVDLMLGVKQSVTDLTAVAYQDILEMHKLSAAQVSSYTFKYFLRPLQNL